MSSIFLNSRAAKAFQRAKLLILLLVFSPSVLVAVFFFYTGHEFGGKHTNYGLLLSPPQALSWPKEKRAPARWRLFFVVPHTCDDLCQFQLFLMRQIYLGVGSKAIHIDPFVFSSQPLVHLSDWIAQKRALPVSVLPFVPELAALPLARGLYLADPRGFVVMAWPERPVPRFMMRDLDKIMKFY